MSANKGLRHPRQMVLFPAVTVTRVWRFGGVAFFLARKLRLPTGVDLDSAPPETRPAAAQVRDLSALYEDEADFFENSEFRQDSLFGLCAPPALNR